MLAGRDNRRRFLGRERDNQLREIFTSYGRKDIYAYDVRNLIQGSALVDDAPLSKLIAKYIDRDFLREVAAESSKGRVLLIGTTDLDAQRPVLWDMGHIAQYDSLTALELFRKVLLASATLGLLRVVISRDERQSDRAPTLQRDPQQQLWV